MEGISYQASCYTHPCTKTPARAHADMIAKIPIRTRKKEITGDVLLVCWTDQNRGLIGRYICLELDDPKYTQKGITAATSSIYLLTVRELGMQNTNIIDLPVRIPVQSPISIDLQVGTKKKYKNKINQQDNNFYPSQRA